MNALNGTDYSGQQFGNYELEALLKHRAVTDLYLARDVKLDQPVFVEVLRTPVAEDPALAGRFQRRMETISQVKSDNIASVIETGVTDDGFAYAVIEYIDGLWMNDVLTDWRERGFLLPVGDALALGKEIAEGLSAGHSAGLIHHDLRPSNILLRAGDNTPVLIDFGVPVANNLRNGVFNDSRTSMLDYASPEELDGKTIGRRSNIYSLGIMLYELLTGHRPELPTSSWDIFEHSTMPKEVPLEEAREGLSGETYRLVRNCLWRQEWSRFETADEVISAIETAILAEQAVPKAAIWSGGQNNWLYFAVPALALVVLVVGLFLLWSQFANAEPQGAQATGVAETVNESDEQSPVENADNVSEAVPTTAPLPTDTRVAPPTSETAAIVPVFGPVSDQVFERNETISFAWIWLNQPQENETFTVYITSEDTETAPIAIGNVSQPDNASLYRLDASADQLDLAAGSHLWQVRLENQLTGETIVESDSRRFIIAEEPTATPSPTATLTSVPPSLTATPSMTPPPATSTPTLTPEPTQVVCVPSRPLGWVDHTVQSGDTISFFASRANLSVQTVLDANCLSRGAVLSVGQVLYVPAPPATPTFTPRPTSAFPPTSTPVPNTGGGGSGGGSGGGGNDGGGSNPEPTEPPPRPTKTVPPVES
ncbi:MAG: protein kinase domain-containing protein [Candidatus Promineifilaceae bacterium]